MDKTAQFFREKSGAFGIALAILTLAWSSIGGYVESATHVKDIQQQQEKRISDLEAQIRNDVATRRELQAVGAKVDHIQHLLEQEIEFHHRKR
jgi:hypothetical protein